VTGPRAILSLKYTAAGRQGNQLAGGFARYIQYRDRGEERSHADDSESFTRYAAYRDHATPEGRLFDGDGTIGDEERRALVRHIRETTVPEHGREAGGRAFYRMIISPEDARGVDLRELTRRTMAQLKQDCGRLPPWIAAEHRNTHHPHVHVILAARHKEVSGRARTLIINKPRLERMKRAMTMELARQRTRDHARDRPLTRTFAVLDSPGPRTRPPEEAMKRMVRGETRLSRSLTKPARERGLTAVLTILASTFNSLRRVEEREMAKRNRERQQDDYRAQWEEEENRRRRSRGRSR